MAFKSSFARLRNILAGLYQVEDPSRCVKYRSPPGELGLVKIISLSVYSNNC